MKERIAVSVVSSLLTLIIVTAVSLIKPSVIISWLGGATGSDIVKIQDRLVDLEGRVKYISVAPDEVTVIGGKELKVDASGGTVVKAGTKTFSIQPDGNLAVRDARALVCWNAGTSEYQHQPCAPER